MTDDTKKGGKAGEQSVSRREFLKAAEAALAGLSFFSVLGKSVPADACEICCPVNDADDICEPGVSSDTCCTRVEPPPQSDAGDVCCTVEDTNDTCCTWGDARDVCCCVGDDTADVCCTAPAGGGLSDSYDVCSTPTGLAGDICCTRSDTDPENFTTDGNDTCGTNYVTGDYCCTISSTKFGEGCCDGADACCAVGDSGDYCRVWYAPVPGSSTQDICCTNPDNTGDVCCGWLDNYINEGGWSGCAI